ncbi:MAG: sulfite oxidase [Blastocatellales bacterium]
MMKKTGSRRERTNGFTRRKFMAGIAETGALIGLSRFLPVGSSPVLAQTLIEGKEKLIVRSIRPEDLETPVGLLNSYLTPKDLFYVRTHTYPARVEAKDAASWPLKIDGMVDRPMAITLDELKKLPRASVTVTLECAGNGRAFYDPPVPGIQWEKGAVGTCRWTGARLSDVLKKAGLKAGVTYIAANGADKPVGKMPDFIRNVPVAKAMHPDTILAYEMNGEPIPQLHGFPLRLIVPGWEGAYAVKWVNHLEALDKEHEGFFVKTAYRYPNKRVAPGAAVPPQDMEPLTGLIVKSLINAPLDGSTHKPGRIRISGFAWAGESSISRVDVSMDNGSTWVQAKLGREKEKYSWQSFEHEFTIDKPGAYQLMARATDDKGRQQPVVPQWNPSGYLWNVIDLVRINVNA